MHRTPSKGISVLRSFPSNEAAQFVAECNDGTYGEKLADAQEQSEYHKEYTRHY